jgi:hypothetical protein
MTTHAPPAGVHFELLRRALTAARLGEAEAGIPVMEREREGRA